MLGYLIRYLLQPYFQQICETLGWEGKGGRFDVLPLILQANGGEPEMFEIPPEIVLEVEMKHPK